MFHIYRGLRNPYRVAPRPVAPPYVHYTLPPHPIFPPPCRELTTLWVARLDYGAELKVTDPKEQQRDVEEE